MRKFLKLLEVKPIFTTPSISAVVDELSTSTDLSRAVSGSYVRRSYESGRYLIPTLFALRELPTDRTGFSPLSYCTDELNEVL